MKLMPTETNPGKDLEMDAPETPEGGDENIIELGEHLCKSPPQTAVHPHRKSEGHFL